MAAMKWKGSLVRWFGSVYKMKRDKVYIYIYIEGGEEGKSWGVEANDINYSQSPGLKYPKNSGICSWTEAALVGPDTKCLCLNKGFYPSLPPRLWQIRREFEILFSLPPFSPPLRPYRAVWNFYLAYLRTRWEGRSLRLFFSFVIENKSRDS